MWHSLECLKTSPPQSEEDFLKIPDCFFERWYMPHVIGAIDGFNAPNLQVRDIAVTKDYTA